MESSTSLPLSTNHYQRSQLGTALFSFYRAVPRKPHYSYTMTNVTAGQKRPWDDSEAGANKRPRDKEEPKDWRDVYLKSPERNLPSVRQHRHDRRSPGHSDGGARKRSDSAGRRRREPEHRRTSDHYDRYPKDNRDLGRHDRRQEEPTRRSQSSSCRVEDEKEEGEWVS